MKTEHKINHKRFYKIWYNMKYRCVKPDKKHRKYYTAKGITVCKSWSNFSRFYKDMFESYSIHVKEYGEKETQIDRINGNKGYIKSNCRWATRKEQSNNQSTNWSPKEISFLKENYTKKNFRTTVKVLGRKYWAVYQKANRLGLVKL